MKYEQMTSTLVQLALNLPRVGVGTVRSWFTEDSRFGRDYALQQLTTRVESLVGVNFRISMEQAAEQLELYERLGIWCLTIYDPVYPFLLRGISEAPVVLYGRGAVDTVSSLLVGVVGTRNPSILGRLFTRDFVEFLCSNSIGIASGLALGIDTEAHQTALRFDGRTVAVLAGGVDRVSPSSNAQLAMRILDSGGAILSEHPPDTIPRRAEFVRRNRIISGISIASVLSESGSTGGSIHQARYTAQQRRPLFTFLPDASWPHTNEFSHEGANVLVDELGATKITSRLDYTSVLSALQRASNIPPSHGGQIPLL